MSEMPIEGQDYVAKRQGYDAPRKVGRVQYKILVNHKTSIPGYPKRFSPGEHTIVIYGDQEPALFAKVEDLQDEVQDATNRHDRELARHLVQQKMFRDEETALQGIQNDREQAVEWERSSGFPGNRAVESIFYERNGRSIRPISRVEKIGDLEPPQVEQEKWVRRTVEGLSEAMQKGSGNGDSHGIDELKELVSKQAQQIDSLKSQVAELRKGKHKQ